VIRNIKKITRIASYIILAVQRDKLEFGISKMFDLKKTWIKRPEKFKEILRMPTEVYYNGLNGMGGDCDDYTTLISRIAYHNKLKFRLCFPLKNNTAYHVYPEVYINKKWVDLDAWNKGNKKFKALKIDTFHTGHLGDKKVKIHL